MRADIETVIQTYWTEIDTISLAITPDNYLRLTTLLESMQRLEDLYLTHKKNLYEVQDLNTQILAETNTRKKAYLNYDKRKYLSLNSALSAEIEIIIYKLGVVV